MCSCNIDDDKNEKRKLIMNGDCHASLAMTATPCHCEDWKDVAVSKRCRNKGACSLASERTTLLDDKGTSSLVTSLFIN